MQASAGKPISDMRQNENKNEAESVWLGAQVIIGGNAKFRFEDASLYRMVTFLWFFHFLTQLFVAAKHTQLLVRIKSSGTIGIIALMEALKKLIGSVSKCCKDSAKWAKAASLAFKFICNGGVVDIYDPRKRTAEDSR